MAKKLTIQDMQQLAENRGGRCLSDVYVNAHSELLWQCAEGHEWMAVPNRIQQGAGCPKCSGNARLTIQEMHRLAESRGGKCLSGTYVNNSTPLLWQCREGHQWKATPGNIGAGHWCPTCAGKSKPSMHHIQRIANERGGKCLSHDYVNTSTLMEWQCFDGHQWKANWNSISQGTWCPTCSTGLGERICREYFSQLLGASFPKARPKWLVNKRGNRMELDGYCAALCIAFEYQGEQHYSTRVHFLHNIDFDLLRRQEDDALKSSLCAQRRITLIAVPQIPTRLPLDQVRGLIKEQLVAKGITLPQDFDSRDVDLNRAYRTSGSREALNYLREIAAKHGGKCLSDTYVNSQSKLLWQCAKGHQWKATPNAIQQGSWCPQCGGSVRRTLEGMQKIAAAKGGKCLSTAYLNGRTKLLWQCARGHHWKATPGHVVSGRWCPRCGASKRGLSRRLGLPAMQTIAASRGGRCLSDEYADNRTRLVWECAKGHQWKAMPDSVKSGTWCPECAGLAKKTIEDMKNLAAQRKGECLSGVYKNNRTKLLWQCQTGHQWQATPHHIMNGTWCPVCGHARGGPKRLSIEEMKAIAVSRGGRCLSDEYVNAHAHLFWRCQEGHQWKATPGHIKRGEWCPVCSKDKHREESTP